MPLRSKERPTWIVVADGTHARILANGERRRPVLIHQRTTPALSKRELTSDRPGRARSHASLRRHAFADSDWHRQAMESFVKDLAAFISRAAYSGRLRELVLVLAPSSLGQLRAALGTDARHLVTREIAKNLAALPLPALKSKLAELLHR